MLDYGMTDTIAKRAVDDLDWEEANEKSIF
jgi:hypothetical protein